MDALLQNLRMRGACPPDRFFIHEQHYKEFVEGFRDSATKLRLGDGLDPATDMGPLINEQRRTDISIKVAQALDSGAHLECGGGPAEEFDTGYFYKPTVLTNVSDEMLGLAEENFGPIAAITSFSNEDSDRAANSSPYGFVSICFYFRPRTRSPNSIKSQSRYGWCKQLCLSRGRSAFWRNEILGHGPARAE